MFLSRKGTNFVAISHDPKQARLFNASGDAAAATPDKKKDVM
jgi:hypothetical protein